MSTILYAAWPYLCIGLWMLIVTWLLLANHRVHSRPKPQPEPVDPPTQFLPFLPPVPPSRCAIEDDWMALVPVECLSDDEIGLRLADIEAREGWAA